MKLLLGFLTLFAALQARPEPHWLGEMQIVALPGESVSSREGPDFTVRNISKDGRILFSAYSGRAPAIGHYRRERFRRACGAEYFRLWSRSPGPARIEGYLVHNNEFYTHLFGEAVTGTRASLRAFERRIIFGRC